MSAQAPPAGEAAIWHDVECGAYAADLGLWSELAAEAGGPVLELGCGTGRVALALARDGHEVVAVDRDAELLSALDGRAAAAGIQVETVCADLLGLDLGRAFGLVIAPMQILQVLDGGSARVRALRAVRDHLAPHGLAAAAIVDDSGAAAPAMVPAPAALLPDVREVGDTVYSSLPVGIVRSSGSIDSRRLRQRVSPAGELDEWIHVDRLARLDATGLDAEAASVGLRSAGRRHVAGDDAYVGSTVLLWRVT